MTTRRALGVGLGWIALAGCGGAATGTPTAPVPARELPKAAPASDETHALVKALRAGDEASVVGAARKVTARAEEKKPLEDELATALWDAFARMRPSKGGEAAFELPAAIVAAKHPSFGPKAVAMIEAKAPDATADEALDAELRRSAAVGVVGELGYEPGAKALVRALMTPAWRGDEHALRRALRKMYRVAEPELVAALEGVGEYRALGEAYPNGRHVRLLAEALGDISRPGGREAILAALARTTNDGRRAHLAVALASFPADATTISAFQSAYERIPKEAGLPELGGGKARIHALAAAGAFFEPALTPWILRQVEAVKGDPAYATGLAESGLPAVLEGMTAEQVGGVANAMTKLPDAAPFNAFHEVAAASANRCRHDASCWLGVLGAPVPKAPAAAKMGHVKAIHALAAEPREDTKEQLALAIEHVDDRAVRVHLLDALLHLSPRGDAALAARVEGLARTTKDTALAESMLLTASKLRSRVP